MLKRLILLLLLLPALAWGGVEQLSQEEFRALATELAPKVNLFQEAWKKDPKAEFYGGTTRDFLYWVKGNFREAHSKEAALAVAERLRALPIIDVRDFIIGDSDVDVITDSKVGLDPKTYGVRKIDDLSPEIFIPGSEAFHNEQNQGFIPAEKIRLSKDGFRANAGMGDGLGEIYTGKITINFADPKVFATTKYAKEGANHPILLALRYLRLSAINYYQAHGGGLPDKSKLFAFDPDIKKAVKAQIDSALSDPNFPKLLENKKFVSWLNGSVQKAFRSYTNPTAALMLMKEFGVHELPQMYPQKIEPVNQYVFSQFRDPAKIEKMMAEYKVDRAKFFQDPKALFSDGKLYHGTKTETAFRAIIFQGVLGSESGSAGAGLYGVPVENKKFSEEFGGSKDRLLSFPVKPEAKIVDMKTGEGERVWKEFLKRSGASPDHYEDFAEAFGIDILRYPYNTDAYVVKNSEALGRAEGVYRQVQSFSEVLPKFKGAKDPLEVMKSFSVNNFSQREIDLIWDATDITPEDLIKLAKNQEDDIQLYVAKYALSSKKFRGSRELFKVMAENLINESHANFWDRSNAVIAEPLSQYPDLVVALAKNAPDNNMVERSILSRVFHRLEPKNQKELVELWMATKKIPVSEFAYGYLGGGVDDDKLEIAKKLFKDRTLQAGLVEYVSYQPGWEDHPEIIEDVLKSGNPDARRMVIKLLKNPQWHNPEILALLVNESPRFFDLFNSVFSAEHWADQPKLFEKAIRRFLTNRKFNGSFHEPSDLRMLDAVLKERHWQNHPDLLKLTGGKPVNLKNLEEGFRRGRTLLDKGEIPWNGFAATCGAFFRRFAQ